MAGCVYQLAHTVGENRSWGLIFPCIELIVFDVMLIPLLLS